GNYTNPNSFVAVTDIDGGAIKQKITVSSRPQSIVAHDGSVFVVCESGKELIKINPTSLEVTARKILEVTPNELIIQKGQLMLYSTSNQQLHLDKINPQDLSLSKTSFD